MTTSSLKKDEEINNLKQKHADEITSLKEELREEMRHLFTQLLQNNPGLNFQDIPRCVGSNLASPIDASSAQAVKGHKSSIFFGVSSRFGSSKGILYFKFSINSVNIVFLLV